MESGQLLEIVKEVFFLFFLPPRRQQEEDWPDLFCFFCYFLAIPSQGKSDVQTLLIDLLSGSPTVSLLLRTHTHTHARTCRKLLTFEKEIKNNNTTNKQTNPIK